jgi:hypothetical protein
MPRLREALQKIPKSNLLSGDFHVHPSLQRPCLFVFVHLCRRPPVPHSPRRPSVPLRVPRRKLLWRVFSPASAMAEAPCVIPSEAEGSAFRPVAASPTLAPPSPPARSSGIHQSLRSQLLARIHSHLPSTIHRPFCRQHVRRPRIVRS